jgi:hypothetical protein
MSHGFQLSCLQAALCKLYGCYNDLYLPIKTFVGSHAVRYGSYQSLRHSWHTDLDYDWYRLSNLEMGLTALCLVNRGFLPLYGTLYHLWYIQMYLICISHKTWHWLLFVIFLILYESPKCKHISEGEGMHV